MNRSDVIKYTIKEYKSVFASKRKKQTIEWDRIEEKLQSEMEWTKEGANSVATIAKDYGAFVLRNALALAISLKIEDGELEL